MEHSLSRERRALPGLPVLLLGGFVTVFDLFVVNVAAPVIQRQFAADFAGVGLIVAGYELAFGVLLIAGGRLGDRFRTPAFVQTRHVGIYAELSAVRAGGIAQPADRGAYPAGGRRRRCCSRRSTP